MATSVGEEIRSYSRIYRWLGLCIDNYAYSEDEEEKAMAEEMRKNPGEVLDALVQIRMALIAFKMTNVENSSTGAHDVKKSDLRHMLIEFPPKAEDKWWQVWRDYLEIMDEAEWAVMWKAVDLTIEDILTGGRN